MPPGDARTHKHRRHPRTRHDAEILCPIDCGNPRDLCRCLQAMLHDRDLVARPRDPEMIAMVDPADPGALHARLGQLAAENIAAEGWGAAVGARHEEMQGIRRALDDGPPPIDIDPAHRGLADGCADLAATLWRTLVRALGGRRA